MIALLAGRCWLYHETRHVKIRSYAHDADTDRHIVIMFAAALKALSRAMNRNYGDAGYNMLVDYNPNNFLIPCLMPAWNLDITRLATATVQAQALDGVEGAWASSFNFTGTILASQGAVK